MNDFYIRMSDGKLYLIRGEKMEDILSQIGEAKLMRNGFLDVREPATFKYVTININQIVAIEEDDEY